MAYATLFHVEGKNPVRGKFSPNSKPTATQVLGFLDEAGGIMDTVLRQANYTVPFDFSSIATSTQFVLQNANAVGAAYMAEWAAPVSDRRKEFEDMWESAQRMLKTMDLDIPRTPGESQPRGNKNATPPFFTRDMVT